MSAKHPVFARFASVTRLAILTLLFACAPQDDNTLVVFAASSLTDAFEELEREFEREHDVDVRLVFAGSQTLRLQIEQGAHTDVIATANQTHLEALHQAGLVDQPRPFAHNELVLIVPRDSSIEEFANLIDAERVVIGTRAVPVGAYARDVIARSELDIRIASEESNARLVRAKVELGEADAALVYRTDVNDAVRAIDIPPAVNAHAAYGVARTSERGAAWIEHLLSDEGQTILRRHGFAP